MTYEIPESQKQELARRLQAAEENPDLRKAWEDVVAEWDREDAATAVPPTQVQEIQRQCDVNDANPGRGKPWAEVRERFID